MRRYRWVRNSILAASVLVLGMGSSSGSVYAQEETEAPEACVRILQRLDADKHVLEERCVDENNRLVIGPDGYAMVCYAYDENGKKTEEAYFDEAEHSLINPDGYALARFVYDENGKVVEETYYSEPDVPVLVEKKGFAQVERTFDQDGYQLTEAYYDQYGKPVPGSKGYASVIRLETLLKPVTLMRADSLWKWMARHVSRQSMTMPEMRSGS